MTCLPHGRLVAALLAAGISATAAAQKRPVAIMGIDSPPYLSGLADEIARIAMQAARKHRRVIPPDRARAALGEDAIAKLAACGDVACREGVLQPLGAVDALGGNLSQNETSYVVDLWLIDVAGRRPVAQISRSILIASRRLEQDMAEAIPAMLAGRGEENGEVAVHVLPPAALVTIDDTPVGGGSDVRRSLEPGKHRIVIQADGYLTSERWIQLAPGQVVRLDERLVPTSGHMAEAETAPAAAAKPASQEGAHSFRVPVATWVTLGMSAAALGTGLYFGLTASGIDHQAGKFDANGVDQGLTRLQAVQGRTDAAVANYLFVGAGAVLVAAIVIAIVAPSPAVAPSPSAGASPAALRWSFP